MQNNKINLEKMNKKIYTLDQKKLIKKILKNNKKI